MCSILLTHSKMDSSARPLFVIGAVIGAVEFGTTSILAEMIYNKFSLIQDLVDDDQSQGKVCGV